MSLHTFSYTYKKTVTHEKAGVSWIACPPSTFTWSTRKENDNCDYTVQYSHRLQRHESIRLIQKCYTKIFSPLPKKVLNHEPNWLALRLLTHYKLWFKAKERSFTNCVIK